MAGREERALDEAAADRVRAVEDDEVDAGRRARARHQHGGPEKGVGARADVEKIDDDRVEAGQPRGIGLAALAVEGIDGDAEAGMAEALPLDHVGLRLAPPAVLGAEERGQLDGKAGEDIGGVAEVGRDGGLVREQPDPPAPERAAAGRRDPVESASGHRPPMFGSAVESRGGGKGIS